MAAWICECLTLYKVTWTNDLPQELSRTVEDKSRQLTQMAIKCSMYQDDALSPLLSLQADNLDMNTNSNRTAISHLIYMGDIRLHAKSERDIDFIHSPAMDLQ